MVEVANNRSPFSLYLPVAKAYDSPDGKSWCFEAPLSDPSKDLQKEHMDMAGLRKGLAMFRRLNMPVDWDHLWERTREPKYLIGRGVELYDAPHPTTGEIVPFVKGVLYKGKEIARQAREHYEADRESGGNGGLGISVAGQVLRRDPLDKSHILEPMVTSIAFTTVPVQDKNAGTVTFCKALLAAEESRVTDLSKANFPFVPELHSRLIPVWSVGDIECHLAVMRKAMEATGALPHCGPGANALELEVLVGKRKRDDDDEAVEEQGEPGPHLQAVSPFKKAYDATLASQLRRFYPGLSAPC